MGAVDPPGPRILGRDGRWWTLTDPAAVAARFDPAKEPQIDIEQGTPLKKIRHPFATEAEATRATEAALSGAARAAMTLNATLSGFEPGLLGGASATVTGLIPPELNGD